MTAYNCLLTPLSSSLLDCKFGLGIMVPPRLLRGDIEYERNKGMRDDPFAEIHGVAAARNCKGNKAEKRGETR